MVAAAKMASRLLFNVITFLNIFLSLKSSRLHWKVVAVMLLLPVQQIDAQCIICEMKDARIGTDVVPEDIKTCPKCMKLLSEEVDGMREWMTNRKENVKSLVQELEDLKLTAKYLLEKSKEFKDNITNIMILNAGDTGATGGRGGAGGTGPSGATGFTGVPGEEGIVGTPGSAGVPGAPGAPNYMSGPIGDTGYTGYTGSTGDTGILVSTRIGVAGPTGSTGAPGDTGYTGSPGFSQMGSLGMNGSNGSTGSPGASGSSGTVGVDGQEGSPGVAGIPGLPGPQGLVTYSPEDIPLSAEQLIYPFKDSVEERWREFLSVYDKMVYDDDNCSVCVSSFTKGIVQSLYRMSEQMIKDEPVISRLIYERYRIIRLLATIRNYLGHFKLRPITPETPEGTVTCVLDIVFVVDVSPSVTDISLAGIDNFELIRQFLKNIVQSPINLGPDRDRVGLVVFGAWAETLYRLTNNQSIESFTLSGIGGIRKTIFGTNAPAGLNSAFNLLAERRSGAKSVVILMTDGGTNLEYLDAFNPSIKKLIDIGATRIAIGVSSSINLNELKAYATSEHHVKTLQSFNDLKRVQVAVINSIITECNRPVIPDFLGIIPKGPSGATGSTGRNGFTGRAGSYGSVGATGPLGFPGIPGATGVAGYQGATGPLVKGILGVPGIPGRAGMQGTPGSPDMVGPPGVRGRDGEQGIRGPEGPQGYTGAPGMEGAPGAPGLQGPVGSTGGPGAHGLMGATGETGATGATGDIGAPGKNIIGPN